MLPSNFVGLSGVRGRGIEEDKRTNSTYIARMDDAHFAIANRLIDSVVIFDGFGGHKKEIGHKIVRTNEGIGHPRFFYLFLGVVMPNS